MNIPMVPSNFSEGGRTS